MATTGADGRDGTGFKKIQQLVRNHSGVDFSLYKSATIQRRVARRMVLNRLDTHAAYAGFLRGNTRELESLFSDMLISVTSFFRNPEAFDLLQRKVFPKLLALRSDTPVRIWVLGCSTGQEAYSLAMAFAESAGNSPRARKLQIFATDLNDALLDKARAGLYTKNLAQDISPARLRRFFTEEEGGYRATKELRQSVVFAKQNVLGDPPFSRMDLISCRNLLIYFEQGWQRKIIPMFHYALNPGGTLLLGASESVAGFAELFDPLDKRHKIFAKRPALTTALSLPMTRREHPAERPTRARRLPAKSTLAVGTEFNAQREADRLTVNQFAPPGVLINAALQVLQFRGPTGAFLEPPPGNASFDLLKMAREGLMLPLRAAIAKAKKDGRPVRKEHVPMRQDGGSRDVTLQVTPLRNLKERCFLVLFEDERRNPAGGPAAARLRHPPGQKTTERPQPKREESRRIRELDTELAETRDYIQSVQEQNEAASEELQASNEEVTSANEELQSINEELETSKEELESANEELTTVNEEMANRNTELNRLNADLNNLHVSINTAILVLAGDLTIRRFTPVAEKVFDLRASDIGRPLSGVRHRLDLSIPAQDGPGPGTAAKKHPLSLEDLVREVIDTVSVRTCEARDRDGRWYSLRVRPYLTLDRKIDGAVLVLVDIDAVKRSEQEARRATAYTQAILRTTRSPLLVLRPDLRVNTANEAFYKSFKTTPAETEGRLFWDLGRGQWQIPRLREMLEGVIPRNSFFDEFEVVHDVPGLGPRTMLLNARRLDAETGTPAMILLAIEDVSERQRLDATVRRDEARFRALALASPQIIWTANADGLVEEDSPSWRAFTGQTLDQWRGWGWLDAIHPDDRAATKKTWSERVVADRALMLEYRLRRADGIYRWTAVRVAPVLGADGSLIEWIGTNTDITEQREAGQRIRLSELRYRTLFELGPVAVYSCDASGVIRDFNRRAVELWGREPAPGDTDERFCGSFKLYRPDGSFMPHDVCPMAEVLTGKIADARDAEVIIERPDASRVTVVVNIRPLKNERGEITGAINCFVDITERKQTEETLRASSRAKDEFLATLSHELRTPLNPVLLLASDAAANAGLPEEIRADFDAIRKNISLEARLIDDLLDLTRISRGKLKIELEPCDAHAVLRDAIGNVQDDLDERRIQLSLDLPVGGANIMGDPVRLQQIYWNVLRNAVQFTPRDGTITVQSRFDPAGAAQVVTITDSGTGIVADDLTRIFETFTQGENASGPHRRSGGLGLGLSISRKLVELHGGTIAAASSGRGRGATFTITLPLLTGQAGGSPAAAEAGEIAAAQDALATANPFPRAASEPRARALIVEDHAPTRAILERLLGRRNFEVLVAASVAEALAIANHQAIDLVISDIGLPDADGYSLMRQLRTTRPGLRGIALSGYGAGSDLAKSREAGFVEHLTKPVSIENLDRVLKRLGGRAPFGSA